MPFRLQFRQGQTPESVEKSYGSASAASPTHTPNPAGSSTDTWQRPLPHSLGMTAVWHNLTQRCVACEQIWPDEQGQGSPAVPLPGLMHVVVPSSRTTMHASPAGQLQFTPDGHGNGSVRLQSTAGTHTGTTGRATSPSKGRSAQWVPCRHSLSPAQQKRRH